MNFDNLLLMGFMTSIFLYDGRFVGGKDLIPDGARLRQQELRHLS